MRDNRHPPQSRPLDLREFEDLLDRLGPDTDTWPDAETAARLLAESGSARALQRASADLHARLASTPAPQPSPNLQARILAAAGTTAGAADASPAEPGSHGPRSPHRPQPLMDSLVGWLQGALWRPALGAAASLVLGFALGLTTGPTGDDGHTDIDYGDYMTLLSLQDTLIEVADDEP